MYLKLITPDAKDLPAIRRDVAARIRREWKDYDQNQWGETIDDPKFDCGTAGCVAFHAAVIGKRRNLFQMASSRFSDLCYAQIDDNERLGLHVLGLERDDAKRLFSHHFDCLRYEEDADVEEDKRYQENKRQNAFRVAQLLDRLADGWTLDKALENRFDPVNEDDYNEDGTKKELVPASDQSQQKDDPLPVDAGPTETKDESERRDRPVPDQTGTVDRVP